MTTKTEEIEQAILDAIQPYVGDGKSMVECFVINADWIDSSGNGGTFHFSSLNAAPSRKLGLLRSAVIVQEQAIWEWAQDCPRLGGDAPEED